jgi:acetyl esterase/lipase
MLIHAGDYDIFLSDSLRLAEKAGAAGLEVQLKVWDEMWHIFHMYGDYSPEGKAALEEVCSYISGKLK